MKRSNRSLNVGSNVSSNNRLILIVELSTVVYLITEQFVPAVDWYWLLSCQQLNNQNVNSCLFNNRAICTRIALLSVSTSTGTALLLIPRSSQGPKVPREKTKSKLSSRTSQLVRKIWSQNQSIVRDPAVERAQHVSKEIFIREKRPAFVKRDLHTSKETKKRGKQECATL